MGVVVSISSNPGARSTRTRRDIWSRKKRKKEENQDLGLVSFFLGLDSDLVSFLGLDSEEEEEVEESEDVAEESLESELEEESPESSLDSPPDFFL
jgi:hypothetical protein